MTIRDTTQAKDQICLRCTDPRQEAPPSSPATCFELTSKKSGPYEELLNFAISQPQSMIQFSSDTPEGVDALYALTDHGRPVTTQTIARLCGGQAPYYAWSPKRLESTSSSVPKDYKTGFIATADDALYRWDVQTRIFELQGEKSNFQRVQVHMEAFTQSMRGDVADWLWSGGLRCYWNDIQYQFSAAAVTQTSSAKPEIPMAEQCRVALQQYGAEAQGIDRRLSEIAKMVAQHYLDRPEETPSFSFCPVLTGGALASYDSSTRSIRFYLDLVHTLEGMSTSEKDDLHIVQAVAAHELGHHRHLIESGAWEMEVDNAAMSYGLPVSVATVVSDVLIEHHMPPVCQGQLIDALRQKHGVSVPTAAWSSWHAPTVTEMIAMLYEMDQIMKDGAPPAFQDESLQQCLNLAHMLAGYYKAFPAVAFELSGLYGLVMLDPKLGPAAKTVGFAMMQEIVRQLPDEAILDLPMACNTPANRAGLTDAQLAQLPPEWCDFFAFARRVRGTMSKK